MRIKEYELTHFFHTEIIKAEMRMESIKEDEFILEGTKHYNDFHHFFVRAGLKVLKRRGKYDKIND